MKGSPYDLTGKSGNSDQYYETAKGISQKIIRSCLNHTSTYIETFSKFISEKQIETLRSPEEYGIEILLIGVMLKEYAAYAQAFKGRNLWSFKQLNQLREKSRYKDKIDSIRGKRMTAILMRTKAVKDTFSRADLKSVIRWMEATGDFDEEVYRLRNWLHFLNEKDKRYCQDFIKTALNEANNMEESALKVLGDYIIGVENYLQSVAKRHNNKEDLVYCSKGKIQYLFNMVAAETMNQVYHTDFLKAPIKKVFAPSCMRQDGQKCKCEKIGLGYSCKGCSKGCQIHRLEACLKAENIEVCMIPHETLLNTVEINRQNKIGIIGIACVPNLISGGWKALRLGFIPQCVLLEYSGCEKHWLEKGKMTMINEARLKLLLNKNISL